MIMKCNSCLIDKSLDQLTIKYGKVRPFCKSCNLTKVKQWRLNNPDKYIKTKREHYKNHCKSNPRYLAKRRVYMQTYRYTPEFHYTTLQYQCKKFNLLCTISFEEYKELTNSSCYYCAGPLPKTGYGIDQIKPRQGYTKDNVRPCCGVCNTAKNDLSETEFLTLIKNIHTNLLEKPKCQRP